MTKKSTVKFARNVTKEQFQKMFEEFQSRHGYMTKIVNNWIGNYSFIDGYLVRAEVPEYNNEYVAITFIHGDEDIEINKSARFLKSIGINTVLTAGKRKLDQFVKEHGSLDEFQSETILDYFASVDELKDIAGVREDIDYDAYAEYLNYIQAFENKIKKYYGDKEIKIVVV